MYYISLKTLTTIHLQIYCYEPFCCYQLFDFCKGNEIQFHVSISTFIPYYMKRLKNRLIWTDYQKWKKKLTPPDRQRKQPQWMNWHRQAKIQISIEHNVLINTYADSLFIRLFDEQNELNPECCIIACWFEVFESTFFLAFVGKIKQ